ncbi:MAG: tetratricopeptide repeat protein [Burkholderiales bacterium]|nr:tetratricopeptide repeat protein [Anaerolineae bacterium]
MPGNREAYENAMNAGHSSAWDLNWASAVQAYSQAIREFPEDPDAHNHLGLALLEMGRLEDSLRVYTRAHQLSREDPIPLEKSADVLERMGRLREAAQQYVNVSELYLQQRDLDKAISNWERATRLTPGLIGIHAKLAQAYERIGDKKRAIREYLMLAFNFHRAGDNDKATKAVHRALRLDRRNTQALNTLRALETGGTILPPDDEGGDSHAEQRSRAGFSDLFAEVEDAQVISDSNPLGPLGEAMGLALGMLASHVIESGRLDAAGGDALQGMELQRQEYFDEAIEAYQRADAKLRHPALKMSLGALLLLREQPEAAIRYLNDATNQPELAAGAYHALGMAHVLMHKQRQAMRYLIQSIQTVDSMDALADDEVKQISAMYKRLQDALDARPDDALEAVNRRFNSLLEGLDWKQRIIETRRQLEETMKEEGEQGAIDILVASRSDELTRLVSRIDRHIRQGLYTLAMDEAHRAVEFSPLYLPVHIRMADVMMREGRVRQAITKYNVVAKSYMVRGENDRATAILSEVLESAPLDISIRKSLIELLETEERWDEALDQYIDLADTYHQLSNFEMSRDTFTLAERMANRVGASTDKIVRIKHRLADIDQIRLDLRRAQKAYEEIVELAPTDERARRMLIDLNYRQGNQVEAVKRLDQLLSIYAKNKQVNRILQLLEELVTLYPNDTGLRSRLAAIYRQLGRKKDAIMQLDALGELQLEAGLHQDAINTIRQIIALKPDGIDDYLKLLAQLTGSNPAR